MCLDFVLFTSACSLSCITIGIMAVVNGMLSMRLEITADRMVRMSKAMASLSSSLHALIRVDMLSPKYLRRPSSSIHFIKMKRPVCKIMEYRFKDNIHGMVPSFFNGVLNCWQKNLIVIDNGNNIGKDINKGFCKGIDKE